MPSPASPRFVLDTNVVMALWVFEDPALARLRHLLDETRPPLLTRADALEELRRVLAYRQFGVAPARQAEVLSAYVLRATYANLPDAASAPAAALPDCRDRDDQKFLEIARDGAATHLVTRDKALLRLNRHRLVRPLFAILTPEALIASLSTG